MKSVNATIEVLFERATSKENVAPGFHPGEGGVNPTVALESLLRLIDFRAFSGLKNFD
jgi:hypothetical protein